MSIDVFLIGMQAIGSVADGIGTYQQMKIMRQGAEIDKAQIENRLEQERLAASMAALDSMQQLRYNLATQSAIFAQRGQQAGAGTAGTAVQTSVKNYRADERIRRMNLLTRESTLRAGQALAGLHTLTSETKMGQSLTRRIFNRLPVGQAFSNLRDRFGIEELDNG